MGLAGARDLKRFNLYLNNNTAFTACQDIFRDSIQFFSRGASFTKMYWQDNAMTTWLNLAFYQGHQEIDRSNGHLINGLGNG